ncbi:hypothetical protein [Gymnodinialimonas hymeniacidonis]|uniref:hypothetical protein n=1 Tax=Gymnodinialimonas hymeniacidonis TaxID=3126508 RepID=UPI0034C6D6DE
MPLSYEIDAKRRLVLVEYWGRAGIDESAEMFGKYAADPNFAPGQIHLFDLRRVTEVEQNFPKFMQFQAEAASAVAPEAMPSMLVYYSPTELARRMAEMVRKSWDGLDGPTLAIIEDEAEALAVAGCTEKSFDELKRTLASDPA